MFTTVCPGCEASLNAPDTFKGKKVKCKKCGEPFVARASGDDDDEPPRKTVKMKGVPPPPKSRKNDDDDVTDEAPSLKGKKSKRLNEDEDTEVMEAARNRDDDDEEDEPKPKKKKKGAGKGKSKKKEGSPAMLIILIAVGAIVLLGGGSVGAYFLFFKEEEAPTNPSAKGGTTPETPKQGVTALAAGWVETHEPGGKYRIKFPSAPTIQNIKQPTALGVVEIKAYLLAVQPEVFVSAHQPVPDRGGLTDDQLLDQAIEMTKLQAKGADVGDLKPITYQSYPGREMLLNSTKKKGALMIRVILAGDRVIVLTAGGDTATADSPRIKAFFESLKIE